MGERYVRIEISDFVMRTFVLCPLCDRSFLIMKEMPHSDICGITTKGACQLTILDDSL